MTPKKVFHVSKIRKTNELERKNLKQQEQVKQSKEESTSSPRFNSFIEPTPKIRSKSNECMKRGSFSSDRNEHTEEQPIIKIGVKRVFQEAFEPEAEKNFTISNNTLSTQVGKSAPDSNFSFQQAAARSKARRLNDEGAQLFVKNVNPIASSLIKLNVGGTQIIVKKDILLKRSESYLHAMFNSDDEHAECKMNKLDDGSIFIDRNPKAFQLMLDYLRYDGDAQDFLFASSRSECKQKMLEQELDFWGVSYKNTIQQPCQRLYDMHHLLNTEPVNLNEEILTRWRALGPINLLQAVKKENLDFLNEGTIDDQGTTRPILFWTKLGRCTGQIFAGNNIADKKGFVRANYKEGIFEGQYCNGSLNGWGRAISKYGYYIGYFKDGRYNGQGTYYPNDDEPQCGFWRNDVLVKNLPTFGKSS